MAYHASPVPGKFEISPTKPIQSQRDLSLAYSPCIACANLYDKLGAKSSNILMCDEYGVIYEGRSKGMHKHLRPHAADTELRELEEVGVALDENLREETFDFADIDGEANVLIFPNLDAGNIAYKLVNHLGNSALNGPVLLGMKKPVNILQRSCGVTSVFNLTAITTLRAQASK